MCTRLAGKRGRRRLAGEWIESHQKKWFPSRQRSKDACRPRERLEQECKQEPSNRRNQLAGCLLNLELQQDRHPLQPNQFRQDFRCSLDVQ